MVAGIEVGKRKPKPGEQSAQAPSAGKPAEKGKPISTKLYPAHARKLSELAYEEGLKGGAAEAFDKHFAALLDNLLIAAKDAALRRLREQSRQ